MKDVKDFQERYNRWKNGERYWDIRGIELPKYDTADKDTNNTAYVYQRSDGTYYSTPTNDGAFIEDITPVLKRNLSDESTWDFVGSNTGRRYNTQYTDEQLQQIAQDQFQNSEMIPWVDRAGNKHRDINVKGLSPADPVMSSALEIVAGAPVYNKVFQIGKNLTGNLVKDFARDFGYTKLGNWTRNKILSKQMDSVINNTYKNFPASIPPIFAKNFITKIGDFGEIELFPIKGGVFDNLVNTLSQKIGKNIKIPKIHLVNKEKLGEGVSGDYNYVMGVANISNNEIDPLSTAIHEAISHHTDNIVENLPVSQFIPNIKTRATVGDVYRYLAQQGSDLHKHAASQYWQEIRATLNELKLELQRNRMSVDDLSDNEILDHLYNINGYGTDYYRALYNKVRQNKPWFDIFRQSYKYLPVTTFPISKLNKNNDEKEK